MYVQCSSVPCLEADPVCRCRGLVCNYDGCTQSFIHSQVDCHGVLDLVYRLLGKIDHLGFHSRVKAVHSVSKDPIDLVDSERTHVRNNDVSRYLPVRASRSDPTNKFASYVAHVAFKIMPPGGKGVPEAKQKWKGLVNLHHPHLQYKSMFGEKEMWRG